METEVRKFYSKNRTKKLIISFISMLLYFIFLLSNWLLYEKTHTILSLIFYIFIGTLIVIIGAADIIDTVKVNKNNTPDIAIYKDKIEVSCRTFLRRKVKLFCFEDIKNLYIPRWDEYIEITIKNSQKDSLNLLEYKDEDKIKIREIFTEIKRELQV